MLSVNKIQPTLFLCFFSLQFTYSIINRVLRIKAQKQTNLKDTAFLSLSVYPYNLKVFCSCFTEIYFFQAIGKNKTWFLISSLTIIFSLLFLHRYFEFLILSDNLTILFIYMTLNNVCFAFFDVALFNNASDLCEDVLF